MCCDNVTVNEKQKTVFGEKPPMIGWRKACTLRDYLVRAKKNKDTKESKSAPCNGKRCQVCQYVEETCEFEDADGSKYDIRNSYKLQHRFYCL